MQQAEGLFQFDFGLPVYENLIVSLVNACHFLRSNLPLIMLYTEAIYLPSVNIQALLCSCICIVLEKFWSQENSFTRNIGLAILAKFTPQDSENRKILVSDPREDFAGVYSYNAITNNNYAHTYSSDCSA